MKAKGTLSTRKTGRRSATNTSNRRHRSNHANEGVTNSVNNVREAADEDRPQGSG